MSIDTKPDIKPHIKPMVKSVVAYIGIGANLGDARAQVVKAMHDIAQLPECSALKRSSLYGSAPLDAPLNIHSPDFVNAVMSIETTLSAQQLLKQLQRIENKAGRVRSIKNAPRTLDLDVLLYGDAILRGETLHVPHPRMHERAFVLLPLIEIAPDIHIPHQGRAKDFVARVMDQRVYVLS